MEAIGEFLPDPAARPGSVVAFALPELAAVRAAAGAAGEAVHSSVAVDASVVEALALLRASTGSAAADAAGLDFLEASDFADQVEDLSRTVEYLQVIAAAAVDRTGGRKRPRAGARRRPPHRLPAG